MPEYVNTLGKLMIFFVVFQVVAFSAAGVAKRLGAAPVEAVKLKGCER